MVDTIIGNTLLNRFRVDALLEGGIPNVYRAWDLDNNIPLVIKEIPEGTANNLVHLEESEWRPQSLNNFAHPNIVTVYGYFRMRGAVFIVEAFIECVTLKKHLYAHNALSIENALIYMKQLCDALFYAHSKGIIHGNLKLDNILINDTGELLLADFGLSLYANDHKSSFIGENLTYAAPEQIKGEEITSATDIYVLGIILFEMLTGEHPFQRIWESLPENEAANTNNEWLRNAHLLLVPINPSEIKPEISKTLSEIILRALEKDYSSRHQNAYDFFLLLSKQNIQKNERISIVSPKDKWEYTSLFRRFFSRFLNLPIIKRVVVKEGKTQLAANLLNEYELVFPYISGNINLNEIFVNRVREVNQLHVSLTSTKQGIVLVFGHRGAGKTRFVETALKKIEQRLITKGEILVSVPIFLSSIPDSDMEILHIILDTLKKQLVKTNIYNLLDNSIKEDLDALLKRLDNSDIQSEETKERDRSLNAGLASGASLGVKQGGSEKIIERKTPKGKSFTSAVQDLRSILIDIKDSNMNYKGFKVKPRIVFTLDEMDKVENIVTVNTALNYLKPVFSSAGAHFVLLISVNQYMNWMFRQKDENFADILSSGRDIYIDCMWDIKPLLSFIVNENIYLAKDDILFNPVEFFYHFLKYLSIQARGHLDKLVSEHILNHTLQYGEEKFLVFSRDEIRRIKLYSGLSNLVEEIMKIDIGEDANPFDKDTVRGVLYEIIIIILESKKYGITRESIYRSIKVPNQALGPDLKKMVETLISMMLSKEYIDQSEQTYYLKKRRIIEKGSNISASFEQIEMVSEVEPIDVDGEVDLLATEQKESLNFLSPATNIHAILKAKNNTLFLTVTDEDPMRFSHEEQRFYEKLDIGRGSENDLQIHEDENVSRYHLRFVFSEDGWYIHDMNTANGTLINGIPTTQTFLSNEDIIFLGNTVIKFLEADDKGIK